MSDPNYMTAGGDGGPDDLPRTLRRERESREREAREREARERGVAHQAAPSMTSTYGVPEPAYVQTLDEPAPAARVTRFDVPFMHMVTFFLKAALAAIPAILVLGVALWIVGHLAQTYFPQLVKMQVLIWFPNNP